MKTKINLTLLIAMFALLPARLSAQDTADKRHALVYMSDGTQYEGPLVGGKQSGEGTLVFADGSNYVGQARARKRACADW